MYWLVFVDIDSVFIISHKRVKSEQNEKYESIRESFMDVIILVVSM